MPGRRIPIRADAIVPARIPSPKVDVDKRPQGADATRLRAAQERLHEDRLLLELLSVADDLERAFHAARADEALCRGLELIHHELMRRLRKYGVERVPAQGTRFDPRRHEVIEVVPADVSGVEPGRVVEELRPGYYRDGRLLRPAWVVVATEAR